VFQIVIDIPVSDPAHVQFWQRHDLCYITCTEDYLFLTRTSVLTVCQPASNQPILALVCTTTYCECTEPGSCCGMQLCIADITTLRCGAITSAGAVPWGTKSCKTQPAALVMLWWLVLLLCVLPSQRVYLAMSAEPWCLCLQKVAQMCTDSPYHHSTSSLGNATCSDGHCQWQRSWMVHVQSGLHEQHSHSWSGSSSRRPAWGAGWPDQVSS